MKFPKFSDLVGRLPEVFCFSCGTYVPDAYSKDTPGRYKAFCDYCIKNGIADKIAKILNEKSDK